MMRTMEMGNDFEDLTHIGHNYQTTTTPFSRERAERVRARGAHENLVSAVVLVRGPLGSLCFAGSNRHNNTSFEQSREKSASQMDGFHAETFVNVGRSLTESQSNLIAMDSTTPSLGLVSASMNSGNDGNSITSSNSSMENDSHLMRSAIIVQSDDDGLGYDNYFGDEEKVEMSLEGCLEDHERNKIRAAEHEVQERFKKMEEANEEEKRLAALHMVVQRAMKVDEKNEKSRKKEKQRAFDEFIEDLGKGYIPEEILQDRWEEFEKVYRDSHGTPSKCFPSPVHARNKEMREKWQNVAAHREHMHQLNDAYPTCAQANAPTLPTQVTPPLPTPTTFAEVHIPKDEIPPSDLPVAPQAEDPFQADCWELTSPISIPARHPKVACDHPRYWRPFTAAAPLNHPPDLLPDWGCRVMSEMEEQWDAIQALQTQLTHMHQQPPPPQPPQEQQQQQSPQPQEQPREQQQSAIWRGDFLAVVFYNACCGMVLAIKHWLVNAGTTVASSLVAAGRAVVAGALRVQAGVSEAMSRLAVLCILSLLVADWCVCIVCMKIWDVVWVPCVLGVALCVKRMGEWKQTALAATGWEAAHRPSGAGLVLAALVGALLAVRWGMGGEVVDIRQGLRRGVTRQVRQQCLQIRTLVGEAVGDQEVSAWEQTANRRCGTGSVTVHCGGGPLDVRCGMENGYDWVGHGVALDNATRRVMFDDYLNPANRTHTHPLIDAYLFSTRLFAYAGQDRAYFEAHIHTSEEEQGMTRLFHAYLKHHLLTTLGSQTEARLLATELRLWVGSRSVCDFESDPWMRWQLLPLDVRSNYQCEKEKKVR